MVCLPTIHSDAWKQYRLIKEDAGVGIRRSCRAAVCMLDGLYSLMMFVIDQSVDSPLHANLRWTEPLISLQIVTANGTASSLIHLSPNKTFSWPPSAQQGNFTPGWLSTPYHDVSERLDVRTFALEAIAGDQLHNAPLPSLPDPVFNLETHALSPTNADGRGHHEEASKAPMPDEALLPFIPGLSTPAPYLPSVQTNPANIRVELVDPPSTGLLPLLDDPPVSMLLPVDATTVHGIEPKGDSEIAILPPVDVLPIYSGAHFDSAAPTPSEVMEVPLSSWLRAGTC